jgi:transcriptional regulator with XRE-family HTH domain
VWIVVDLAERARVSKSTVSKAERGGGVYSSSVRKMACAL